MDQLWASRSNFEDIFTLVAVGDLKGVKEVVEKDREKLKATEDGEGATPLHRAQAQGGGGPWPCVWISGQDSLIV